MSSRSTRKTGKELWRKNAIDFKTGYSMTVAPLVADGVVITGISGAEFGTRDFIDGWDPKTGEHLWRTYTVPGPGEPGNDTWQGDTWKLGGGSTWITGSFDPELHTVYWGIGNPGPFNAGGAAGRQSLHLLGAGARSQDRQDQVALPVLAEQPVRL